MARPRIQMAGPLWSLTYEPSNPPAMPRGTFLPPVMNAEVISRIPAMAPPMRIGFSRLVVRALAMDAAVLIANLVLIWIGGCWGRSASTKSILVLGALVRVATDAVRTVFVQSGSARV